MWTRGLPYVSSPLLHQGRIYLLKAGGMLTCLDAATGKAHFDPAHGVIAEVAFQTYKARTLPRGPQFAFQRGQKPVESGGDILNLSNGFRESQADGEMMRRARGADRFGRDPKGLIQPLYKLPTEAAGKGRAGLAGKIADAAETETVQHGGGVGVDAKGGDGQVSQRGT